MVEGEFIKRINRFVARVNIVKDGKQEEVNVHVANTGRMRELLVPGAKVKMAYHPAPKRKTDYTLLLVNYHGHWVCIHASMANDLAFEYLSVRPEISDLKREVTYQHSRFDISFKKDGVPYLCEVKSANLVVDKTAMFPDAPTERGCKHLKELMCAQREGYGAAVLFIVQRDDAAVFMPNVQTDPAFAALLKQAEAAGVDVRALKCEIKEDTIRVTSEIPVMFNTDMTTEDE